MHPARSVLRLWELGGDDPQLMTAVTVHEALGGPSVARNHSYVGGWGSDTQSSTSPGDFVLVLAHSRQAAKPRRRRGAAVSMSDDRDNDGDRPRRPGRRIEVKTVRGKIQPPPRAGRPCWTAICKVPEEQRRQQQTADDPSHSGGVLSTGKVPSFLMSRHKSSGAALPVPVAVGVELRSDRAFVNQVNHSCTDSCLRRRSRRRRHRPAGLAIR